MADRAVEARLVARVRDRSSRCARLRPLEVQGAAREGGARLAADDLQPVARARAEARRRHRAAHDHGRAGGGLEEHRGERLAPDLGQRPRGARADHAQRPAQEAHDVEMVDQHLGDHQPLLRPAMKGWRSRAGAPAALVRQQARGHHRHAGHAGSGRARRPRSSAPSVRYQGRKRQFSCTMRRARPRDAARAAPRPRRASA